MIPLFNHDNRTLDTDIEGNKLERNERIVWIFEPVPAWLYLFDVKEVLGVKGDAGAGHRNVLI